MFFVTDAEESTPFFQFPGKSWGDINSPDVLVSGTIKTTFPISWVQLWGDVECVETDERASISTVWQLSTQHINHTDAKMQVWTSSLF